MAIWEALCRAATSSRYGVGRSPSSCAATSSSCREAWSMRFCRTKSVPWNFSRTFGDDFRNRS